MAVASRSPLDGRVPCSMCGGLVHPIAGRCKHCKGDLAAARTARPQAMAALPPLARSGNAAPPPVEVLAPAPQAKDVIALPAHVQLTQVGGTTPVALLSAQPSIDVRPAGANAYGSEPVHAREAYNPMPDGRVLPPRPTGRMRATDGRGWFARNWPVFVIILASIAIILAIILMVLPKQDVVDIGKKNGAAGPAPERMETNPLPPQNSDPWQNGQPPSTNQLPPGPQGQVPVPPDDPDDQTMIDPNDPLKDPFSSPRGGTSGLGGLGGSNVGLALLGNIANRICDKAKTCSDPTIATMCASVATFPTTPIPSSCPQAKRCLEIVDQLDVCDGAVSSGLGGPNFPQIMLRTSDCMDALTSC
ncbi:MAG: hypothetical protein ACKV2T_39130 [Kofleriaceae bacterium]